MLPVKTPQTWV